ncbi:hypothetical protein C5O23_13680 [Duncaniella muris]|uniref:PcfJ-like protein n=1 Tax=Duncaniella muris TaxID=2094150 RepID=A0A2V1IK06_9BACT|nr:PcfJ domain-containing protein [Duncaniella muris]PWB00166.1 hypothetical protein C5O23_13680 [Duncaniella muris]
MKPKTMIQKEVARLSATLRPISPKQTEWAYTNCVEHIAYRAKSGMLTCPDCGHSWKSGDGTLCDTLEGCICPHCGAELKVQDTRRRTQNGVRYFCILTTCRGYQVIRVAQAHYSSKKGEPMKFYCTEVVQRWISPDGKLTDMALLRTFPSYYCDQWSLYSDMEVRPYNSLYDDVCKWSEVYPLIRTIPQLRRNGFKGDFYGISPVLLFKRLLSDTRIETLMKAGEIEDMKYFILNPQNAEMLWASYLIARRHHYKINSLELWCDYLQMLNNLGQDIRNPKNICPADFIDAHDRAMRRIEAKRMKERTENERRWEAERRDREQRKLLEEKQREDDFKAMKSKFFGLVISDNEITVKVLESIEEYYEEGKAQNICVFGAGYYTKADSLVLSARIGDRIIETVEVDLQTLTVVQCHGKNNKNTAYHDRIVDLVNSNARLIRERMTA